MPTSVGGPIKTGLADYRRGADGLLVETFDPGVVTKARELRLDFDDGATGQAPYTNVQVAGSRQGLYGWVEVQGNGMPSRA